MLVTRSGVVALALSAALGACVLDSKSIVWIPDSYGETGESSSETGDEGDGSGGETGGGMGGMGDPGGFVITQHLCDEFSIPTGGGDGGGDVYAVCGSVDAEGVMTIRVRRLDGGVFDARPYQVRVSSLGDPPCGPDFHFFVVSDFGPEGIGTDQLVFNYPSIWLEGQVSKGYCVTGSQVPSDPDYTPDEFKQSWWWSQKVALVRE